MAKWLAKEFDWDTGRYTGNYYDIAEAGIVAVFVDSFYGDNTNAGTAAAPFKTLGKAITDLNSTGANGSRIFMNGVFSETLPTQTYWYEFIGCGGGKNGLTVVYFDNIANTFVSFALNSRVQNIETLTYQHQPIWAGTNGNNIYFNNVFFKNARIINGYYNNFYMFNSTLYQCSTNGYINESFRNYLRGNNNKIVDCFRHLNQGSTFEIIGNNNHEEGGLPFISDIGYGNILNVNGHYLNKVNNDFNVRITSPLLGAGTVDELTGIAANVGGVEVGLPYNGINHEFSTEGGATITDLTIDSTGRFTITAPATTGSIESGLMDLGNIYPLENIDLFNVFDFAAGEITQGVFEDFVSPRMALTIKLKYGLTSAEVDDCPWLLIEYGKQPTFSGTGASRVGNADDTFDPNTFQTITCRYMKLFVTLQDNS